MFKKFLVAVLCLLSLLSLLAHAACPEWDSFVVGSVTSGGGEMEVAASWDVGTTLAGGFVANIVVYVLDVDGDLVHLNTQRLYSGSGPAPTGPTSGTVPLTTYYEDANIAQGGAELSVSFDVYKPDGSGGYTFQSAFSDKHALPDFGVVFSGNISKIALCAKTKIFGSPGGVVGEGLELSFNYRLDELSPPCTLKIEQHQPSTGWVEVYNQNINPLSFGDKVYSLDAYYEDGFPFKARATILDSTGATVISRVVTKTNKEADSNDPPEN